MTTIDVSKIRDFDAELMSGSVAELGDQAGRLTWSNCLVTADAYPLVTDENREDIRDHFRGHGAWDAEEIAAWDDRELSAMVWQEAAAGWREYEEHGVTDGRVWVDGEIVTLYLGA